MADINYEEEFRRHWRWMAETGAEYKEDYFDALKIEPRPFLLCYACESISRNNCWNCPVDWRLRGGCMGAEYSDWDTASTEKERKKYAKIISELPWVEK